MSQLTFKFPFKTTYFKEDFYVSSSNFTAYRLIESWPNWPAKNINIFGPSGCGKTHLSNILKKKINALFIKSVHLNSSSLNDIKNTECLIIEDYKNDVNEELLYTLINQMVLSDKYLLINSQEPLKKIKIRLKDLESRFNSFIDIGINLPTDDLLKVILSKFFSDKQIEINVKLFDYILKNIDRSYENIFRFLKDIDMASLSTGKAININLIKKVLNR
jgi:chromosomal replication initiation ATPase DnaA